MNWKLNLLAALAMGLLPASAQGALIAGDVAVVAFQADTPDSFSWVALSDIPASTSIFFTDSSYGNGNGSGPEPDEAMFRWTEHYNLAGAPVSWTHNALVPAGTVIKYTEPNPENGTYSWSLGTGGASGAVDFATAGDQLFAYTGTVVEAVSASLYRGDASGATLLSGIQFAAATWLTSGAGSTSLSYVPSGISVAGNTAIYGGGNDNGYYIGPTTGTPAEIRANLANLANWTTSESLQDMANWPQSFTVVPEPSSFVLAAICGIGALFIGRRRLRKNV